jgi:hypothetical protein
LERSVADPLPDTAQCIEDITAAVTNSAGYTLWGFKR